MRHELVAGMSGVRAVMWEGILVSGDITPLEGIIYVEKGVGFFSYSQE
jgi:hypothetical protein